MQAVLLVGGRGKRLQPFTDTIPKPMVEVAGRPIVVHQIQWLRGFGVDRFVLAVSHLKEVIINALGNGSEPGVHISYVTEEYPLGTAGALYNAMSKVKMDGQPLLVINGDVLTNLNVAGLTGILNDEPQAVGALSLVPLPSPYGVVEMEGNFIRDFTEKPILKTHWINGGIYCLRPEIFSNLPNQGSLELDVFPNLARQQKLLAYKDPNCFWISIDGFKDLEYATRFYQKQECS
ncbi:MAG: NDP-sugar synthase [bacterium]